MCVYCNRSQITSQRVKNKKSTRRSRVAWLLFFTRCDVFCDLLQYTHTEKYYLFVCCLFVKMLSICKNWNGLLKDFGAWKKKNKSSDVIWRRFNVICVCVLQKSRYCIKIDIVTWLPYSAPKKIVLSFLSKFS